MSIVDEIVRLSEPRNEEKFRRYLLCLTGKQRTERLLMLRQDEQQRTQLRMCFWRNPANEESVV